MVKIFFSVFLFFTHIAWAQDESSLIFFRIGAGLPTSTVYALGAAIAGSVSAPPIQPGNCLENNPCGVPGLVAVVQSRAGSIESIKDMVNGELESAIAYADISQQVYQGRFPIPLKGNPENLRMVGDLATLDMHLITRINTGISSLQDLKGRIVAAGTSGSALPLQFSRLLQGSGMSLQDVSPVWVGLAEASQKLLEEEVDAIFVIGNPPLRIAANVLASASVKLISIGQKARDKIVKSEPSFYSLRIIPAGTYRGQTRDIETIGLNVIWLVQKDASEDFIYMITRALWSESTSRFLHTLYPDQTLKRPTRFLLHRTAVPLHKGAARYYKEVGLLE